MTWPDNIIAMREAVGRGYSRQSFIHDLTAAPVDEALAALPKTTAA